MKKSLYTVFILTFIVIFSHAVKNFDKFYGISIVDNLDLKEKDDINSQTINNIKKAKYFEIIEEGKTDIINDNNGKWYHIKNLKTYLDYFEGWIFSPNENNTIKLFNNLKDVRLYHFEIHPLKKDIDYLFNFLDNNSYWTIKPEKNILNDYSYPRYSFNKKSFTIGESFKDSGSPQDITEFIERNKNIFKLRATSAIEEWGLGGYFYIEILNNNNINFWFDYNEKETYIRNKKTKNNY